MLRWTDINISSQFAYNPGYFLTRVFVFLYLDVDQILPATTHDQHMVRQSTYERTIGPGYLYVISESTETGSRGNLFKIGVTNDIKLRLRDLQNGNPRPLIPELLLKVYD